jgi:hypothetical protein
VLSASGLLSFGQLLLQIISKVLRAFLRQKFVRLVRHVRLVAEVFNSSRCASVIINSSIARSYATFAFWRMSSISFDASALVRLSLNSSGVPACSQRVFRYDAWAPVIGSSPETHSSGSFRVLSAAGLLVRIAHGDAPCWINKRNCSPDVTAAHVTPMAYWTAPLFRYRRCCSRDRWGPIGTNAPAERHHGAPSPRWALVS